MTDPCEQRKTFCPLFRQAFVRFWGDQLLGMQQKGRECDPNLRPPAPPRTRTVDLAGWGDQSGEAVNLRVVLPRPERRRRPPVDYSSRIGPE